MSPIINKVSSNSGIFKRQVSTTTTTTPTGVDLLDSTTFSGIRTYLTNRRTNYQNVSFYTYALDLSPGQISDGNLDMYDGGNCISLLESGLTVAGNCYDYNTSNTLYSSNLRHAGFGYATPLICMATSGTTQRRFGWLSNGNLGADGGGSSSNVTVYNTQTVNGCLVHSWLCQKAYNAGDPSVNHLFVTLGHSSFGSQINSIDVTTYNTSTDSDYSQYETTSKNCLVLRLLLSKPSGVVVNAGDCQTVISSLTTDFKAYFGLP
jgi:hypothetical protein